MRLIFRIIGRLFSVVVGYLAASLAAGVTIVLAVTGWVTGYADVQLGTLLSHAIYTGGALAAFVVVLALPGAVIMAVVGELFAIRSGFYYVAVGGLIGALGYVGAAGYGPGDDLPPGATDELMAFLAAGLVGGAVYWLVAGRGAGLWPRRTERHEPETLPSGQ